MEREKKVLEALERLGIPATRVEHPPVFTAEEAAVHWKGVAGAHCKNLFVRNQKGNRHYLIILPVSKKADLQALARVLGEDRFSFASAERLDRFLGLEPGSVSPFGLINDSKKEVVVVLDEDLRTASPLNFHPNVNTATLGLSAEDFQKFLSWCGNKVLWIRA
ncbi:MAG: prolyl-tRNA synthetase associated domain-containing protein [Candidatus Aminicenantes bacterium]|nr:prolyl-tRNA synthetase associated domain-containing protein [Candidatus Aminicenantes bacterium]